MQLYRRMLKISMLKLSRSMKKEQQKQRNWKLMLNLMRRKKQKKFPKALPAEMIQIGLKPEELNEKDNLEVRVVC